MRIVVGVNKSNQSFSVEFYGAVLVYCCWKEGLINGYYGEVADWLMVLAVGLFAMVLVMSIQKFERN